MDILLALAQIDPAIGDLEGNARLHLAKASEAHTKGAGLILFPELSLTGYSVRDLNRDLAIQPANPPSFLEPLLDISREISILFGGIEEDPSHRLYNSAFLLEEGRLRPVHRKVYLPTYGLFEEGRYFSPGSAVRPVNSRLGRFGVLICEDLWHLSMPYLLALQGATVLLGLLASPTRISGSSEKVQLNESNSEAHRTYARLLSCYVASCNRVGFEDGLNFWGGSEIIAPDGSVVTKGRLFENDLLFGRIEGETIRRLRHTSRHFLDEDPHFAYRQLGQITRSLDDGGESL